MLWFALTVWIAGFDLIYACQDVEFDRRARAPLVPARFGIAAALTAARVCHVLTVAAFALLGWRWGSACSTGLGVLVVAGLLVYEHSLVSPDDLSRLDVAFFNVNGYIAVILFAAVLGGPAHVSDDARHGAEQGALRRARCSRASPAATT